MSTPSVLLLRTRAVFRTAFRQTSRGRGVGLGVGLTTASGLVALHSQRPLRLDAVSTTTTTTTATTQRQPHRAVTSGEPRRRDMLDPETVKQLSGGSLAGFFAGLLVSVFSKTLVLLAGIGMIIIQVAARNGIDLIAYLRLKERVRSSRILAALNHHAAFKLSFAVAFSLSAFMSF